MSGKCVHQVLLFLYTLIVCLAIWGVVSRTHSPEAVPVAIWAAVGAVSACGALSELLLLRRTRSLLERLRDQIKRMHDDEAVGLVMLEDQWPLSDLTTILNQYLTILRTQRDELILRQRELDLTLTAVDAEKQNTEAVIQCISDGVVVLNPVGEVILANRHARTLFDLDEPGGSGSSFEAFLDRPELAKMIETAQNGWTQPTRAELTLPGKDGRSLCYQVTVCPVIIRDSQLWAIVLTLQDLTQERELARMKNDFVDHVSHELKTPLSSIKAYLELLMDGETNGPAQSQEFYRIIYNESTRLEHFIENILNLSRLDSGLAGFRMSEFDLAQDLQAQLALLRAQADESGLHLHAHIETPLPVTANRELLLQAVQNLLSNALKYTPRDGHVTLTALRDVETEQLLVEVADTGKGIPVADQDRVFEKFYRGEDDSRQTRGTGLGLTLTKKIVEDFHGGKLTLTSTCGQGSTFRIAIPLHPLRSSDPPAAPATEVQQAS